MSDVTLAIDVDTTVADAKLNMLQQVVNERQAEVDMVVKNGLTQMRNLQRVVGLSLGMLRGLTKAFGMTLDPLMDAALTAVQTTVSTIIQVGMAYLLIPGIGWMIYAAIAAFTLGFSIAATMDIRQKSAEINSKINGIQQALSGLQGLVGMGGGMNF
jgi:site-specific recombinase